MPDSLPLPKRLRQAAEALYGPTPAEMVAIRVLLREAAAALEAPGVAPVNLGAFRALGGIDVIPMPHLPTATIMASPDVYEAFRAAFPSKPKGLCVAPRLPAGEPRTPSAPPPDPSSSVPEVRQCDDIDCPRPFDDDGEAHIECTHAVPEGTH